MLCFSESVLCSSAPLATFFSLLCVLDAGPWGRWHNDAQCCWLPAGLGCWGAFGRPAEGGKGHQVLIRLARSQGGCLGWLSLGQGSQVLLSDLSQQDSRLQARATVPTRAPPPRPRYTQPPGAWRVEAPSPCGHGPQLPALALVVSLHCAHAFAKTSPSLHCVTPI